MTPADEDTASGRPRGHADGDALGPRGGPGGRARPLPRGVRRGRLSARERHRPYGAGEPLEPRTLLSGNVQVSAEDWMVDVAIGAEQVDAFTRAGSSRLVKSGSGALVLDRANSHSGGVVVQAGTLVVRDVNGFGRGPLTVAPGGRVVFVRATGHTNAYDKIRLMALCDHGIIANSTFSWWAAWLNPSPNKIVIAPDPWFDRSSLDAGDLVPRGWLRLPRTA